MRKDMIMSVLLSAVRVTHLENLRVYPISVSTLCLSSSPPNTAQLSRLGDLRNAIVL